MTHFHETRMGRTFFEGHIPRLLKQLERLNDNLEQTRETDASPDSRPYDLTMAALAVTDLQQILWPNGDAEHQHDATTLMEIANRLHAAGLGPTPEPQVRTVAQNRWNNDLIQFARLICEIAANQDDLRYGAVAASMNLLPEQLNDLFCRADQVWEQAKREV